MDAGGEGCLGSDCVGMRGRDVKDRGSGRSELGRYVGSDLGELLACFGIVE